MGRLRGDGILFVMLIPLILLCGVLYWLGVHAVMNMVSNVR